ncbi:MAG: prepilin-type N-terminal cleavage/methylation domain-containing protein, partial [Thermodesulfobacteriaceae bacterium]|nr:prepilin-type N-terminal cleavage/methylation domain-containing protein [Thermodesulfobacteriaceae bacterium]
MKSKRRVYNHKGFTLIEIAIILVILGLLIGVGAALLGPLTKRIKINETRESIDAAVEAVISYASGNKCLPGNLTTANVRKLIDAWNKPLLYIYSSELGA